MTDIYSLQFDPHKISHQQEELGMIFADLDTAVELMKKEEKMIIAELTLQFSRQKMYKNMKELDGLIYNHDKFRDFTNRYSETLKKRNRAKIRFESFKAFGMTLEQRWSTRGKWQNITYRKELQMSESQNKQILEYLKIGNKITSLEALNNFGCFRLSSRIFDLRQRGFNIITEKKKVDGKTFAEYSLEKEHCHD